jgi:ribosomal protein S18 acetylase RimI-like enzyme
MPEIELRPVLLTDVHKLIAIDHDYTSDYVWQMDINSEEGQIQVGFRQMKLPRSVQVDYPRMPRNLADDWSSRSGVIVACLENEVVGYISISKNIAPATAWVTDLAVMRRVRRQGIGSALVLAGQEWAVQQEIYRIVLEMQPKNYPAICFAQKLGFEFCGYNDRYYINRDIGLFFAKSLR